MLTVEIAAGSVRVGDRLNLAGSWFIVTREVHGAWYLDGPRTRYIEIQITPEIYLGPGTYVPSVLRIPKRTVLLVDRDAADTAVTAAAQTTNPRGVSPQQHQAA